MNARAREGGGRYWGGWGEGADIEGGGGGDGGGVEEEMDLETEERCVG